MVEKEIVIDITPQGGAQALHMDAFSLDFLGRMNMSRASNITFDNTQQGWVVSLPYHKAIAHLFNEYGEAREFEVLWLQKCRKLGTDPSSTIGGDVAEHLLEEWHWPF